MISPVLIALIKERLPGWAVQVAPDMVNMGAGRLVTVRASAFPVQGLLGARHIVDVGVYSVDADEAFKKAREVLAFLDQAVLDGAVTGVSRFRALSLPSFSYNSTGGKSASRVEFTFELIGRYEPV